MELILNATVYLYVISILGKSFMKTWLRKSHLADGEGEAIR